MTPLFKCSVVYPEGTKTYTLKWYRELIAEVEKETKVKAQFLRLYSTNVDETQRTTEGEEYYERVPGRNEFISRNMGFEQYLEVGGSLKRDANGDFEEGAPSYTDLDEQIFKVKCVTTIKWAYNGNISKARQTFNFKENLSVRSRRNRCRDRMPPC